MGPVSGGVARAREARARGSKRENERKSGRNAEAMGRRAVPGGGNEGARDGIKGMRLSEFVIAAALTRC